MVRFIDARIPVRFAAAGEGAALLVEGDAPATGQAVARFTLAATGHAPGCACCLPRAPVAVALANLFRDRATGAVPFFTEILARPATAEGAAAIRAALAADPLVMARFRPE